MIVASNAKPIIAPSENCHLLNRSNIYAKIPNNEPNTARAPPILISSATVGPTFVEETIPIGFSAADLNSSKVKLAGS